MSLSLHRRCKRLIRVATAAAMLLCLASLAAQQSQAAGNDPQHDSASVATLTRSVLIDETASQAEREPIRQYIAKTWDTLTRSTTECKSLVDPKVTTEPVLYLPADLVEPSEIAALKRNCKVDVRRLPRAIRSEGDVRPEELKTPGLLYLPHPYVVPGGRFNEQYGWDSYFIVLGLISDGRLDLARGMVDNFLFEIEHYGALLNANRTYYLTRSQPPLLAEMVREIHAVDLRMRADTPEHRAWAEHAYLIAKRDYALWRTTDHKAGSTGLARYYDLGDGPVIEMADDSTYYPDAIRWMLAHPAEGKQYLVAASAGDKASCDRAVSKVCAAAEVKGMRLSREFYKGDRAMRESGFDTSFRFGAFSGSTHHFAPVCLNSLLFKYELDMAELARNLGRREESATWSHYAEARKSAMNQYLWDDTQGSFVDYNVVSGQRSHYTYATAFYPLWAGIATPAQAKRIIQTVLPNLQAQYGFLMSDRETGMQWDKPFAWAPTTYFAATGLEAAGFKTEASTMALRFLKTTRANYDHEGTLREKYNAQTGTTDTPLTAGYRSNNAGFGWTNGVYLRLLPLESAQVHASR